MFIAGLLGMLVSACLLPLPLTLRPPLHLPPPRLPLTLPPPLHLTSPRLPHLLKQRAPCPSLSPPVCHSCLGTRPTCAPMWMALCSCAPRASPTRTAPTTTTATCHVTQQAPEPGSRWGGGGDMERGSRWGVSGMEPGSRWGWVMEPGSRWGMDDMEPGSGWVDGWHGTWI